MAMSTFFSIAFLVGASCLLPVSEAQLSSSLYEDLTVSGAADQVFTLEDGAIRSLALTSTTGWEFASNQKYLFGWFSMKLKLVAGDSGGVVAGYYMCSENDAGDMRDEVDYEFLGNSTGQRYLVQTNIFKDGTGGREVRHLLWFDPTVDFHTYSVLWNNHQIVFVIDNIPIRVYKNANYTNDFFPNTKPMYLFSSIWNADSWATDGGHVQANWPFDPYVSPYTDYMVDACQWVDPYPPCLNSTSQYWWDQPSAWTLSDAQLMDYDWVQKNFVNYNYCEDTQRYPHLPPECYSSSPFDRGSRKQRG